MPNRSAIHRFPLIAVLLVTCGVSTATTAQEVYELEDGQWLKEQTYPPESMEGRLQSVRKLLAQDENDQAIKQLKKWLTDYPNSPFQAEARLLMGDAKTQNKHYYNALFDYEFVIRAYPASEQFSTALEREYEIARLFVNGMKRRFLGMRILPAEGEGEELLIRIQERAPNSEIGEKASLELADYYYRDGEMINAADAYDLFLINYPRSVNREWAMLRLIQANLARFKGPQFDPTGLIDARTRLVQYQREYPAAAERIGADALIVRIGQSMARKDLVTAQWYEQTNQDVSAAYLYRRLIEDHPETPAAEEAVMRLAALPLPIDAKVFRIEATSVSEQEIQARETPDDPINAIDTTDFEPRPDTPADTTTEEMLEDALTPGAITDPDGDINMDAVEQEIP